MHTFIARGARITLASLFLSFLYACTGGGGDDVSPLQAPTITPIDAQTVEEGQPLSFTVSASNEGPTPVLSATNLPPGSNFDPATGAFSWIPAEGDADASPFNVTFTATDPVETGLSATETVTITVQPFGSNVSPTAAAPTIAPDGGTFVDSVSVNIATATAGAVIFYTLDGSDPTENSIQFGGPFELTESTIVNARAFADGFINSNLSRAIFTITRNEPPVLNPIGAQSVVENEPLSFTVTANDAESTPVLSVTNLPSGATFDPATGIFDWTPADGDAVNSPYSVTFTATDDVDTSLIASETIEITVTAAPNETPVLSPIGDQTVVELQVLAFVAMATDAESTPALSAAPLPPGATFDPVTNMFSWTPAAGASTGSPYAITFTAIDAEDANLTASETISIAVSAPVNQNPVLNAIGDQTVEEQQPLSFTVSATDDGPVPTLSASTLPTGASFTPATGVFSWTPTAGTAASSPFSVTFTATDAVDSGLTDSETISIAVSAPPNGTPVLNLIGNQTVEELQPLSFTVSATDDGPAPILSASNLPSGASFTPATGVFSWTPAAGTAANSPFSITFTATDAIDSGLTASETISITVSAANQTPVLDPIGSQTVEELQPLSFTVSAMDDGPAPILSTSTLPAGASFTPATGVFSWTPAAGPAANSPFSITFTATDAIDSGLTDSETISITVSAANQTPVLDPIGNQTVEELQPLSFTVSATDDGTAPILSTSTLPAGASFTPATGVFSWTPAVGTAANSPFSITFTATDAVDSGLTDNETISITVSAANQTPVLDPIGDQTIEEQQPLSFTISATDDGPAPILSTSTLPPGASFTPATGVFNWTPVDGDAAGSPYSITFTATDAVDSGLTDSETISVTVTALNQTPVLDPIGNQTVEEQQPLSFTVSVTDDDPDPILSTSTLPSGATFSAATGVFSWTPADGDAAGSPYSITFTATDTVDSGLTDSETISIEVTAPRTADCTVGITSPVARDLQTSDLDVDASLSCTPSIPVGWGVKLVAVGVNNGGSGEVTDTTAPFSTTFSSLPKDEYTVTATVVDDNGDDVSGAQTQAQVTPVGIGDYYLAVGDSITSGRGGTVSSSADGRDSGTGYPPTLNDLLTIALGYPHTVINAGVEGESSQDGAGNIAGTLNANPEAQTVLVMYGMNDANPAILPIPPATFKANMQTIINAITNSGKEVVLAKINVARGDFLESAPYAEPDGPLATRNLNIKAFNTVIDELRAENNISIVAPDFYNLFLDNATPRQVVDQYSDNIHPDGTGYSSMANVWSQRILE